MVLKLPADRVALPSISGCEGLAGIEINGEQTFGFEVEFGGHRSRQRWTEVAWPILSGLREVVPTRSQPGGKRPEIEKWKIVKDRSCGWEVNTRVLKGIDGVREVVAGLRVLRELAPALRVGHSVKTSTHVHLGWVVDLAAMSRLVEIVAYFEPALVRLVEPYRPHSPYCQSIGPDLEAFRANTTLQDWKKFYETRFARRDRVISLKPLIGRVGTVEVRLHHGTFDPLEVVPWLALWMSILNAAKVGSDLPFVEGCWDSSSDRDASERRSITALCRFMQADAVLEARLLATCEKHERNWAGRKVPMPRQRNRATLEGVLARLAARGQPFQGFLPVEHFATEPQ